MDTTQIILCIISSFILGACVCSFVLWLVLIGIPYLKNKKWEKLENDVVYIVKKNFEKPINITKEYIKDLMKEIENEQKKQNNNL